MGTKLCTSDFNVTITRRETVNLPFGTDGSLSILDGGGRWRRRPLPLSALLLGRLLEAAGVLLLGHVHIVGLVFAFLVDLFERTKKNMKHCVQVRPYFGQLINV